MLRLLQHFGCKDQFALPVEADLAPRFCVAIAQIGCFKMRREASSV